MLKTKLKSKTVGILILTISVILLLLTISGAVLLSIFGIKSGGTILLLIPLIVISLISTALCILGIYIGIRYIKDKGFKQNVTLGKTILIITTIYFTYTVLTYLFSNLTDNQGGWLKVVLALIVCLIAVPLGLTIKNGTTK